MMLALCVEYNLGMSRAIHSARLAFAVLLTEG